MPGFGVPTIVWLDANDRAKLLELAQHADAPAERVGGRMLARALLTHTPGDLDQQAPKATTNRAGKKASKYCIPRSAEGIARSR
jgi:hypothetical protein